MNKLLLCPLSHTGLRSALVQIIKCPKMAVGSLWLEEVGSPKRKKTPNLPTLTVRPHPVWSSRAGGAAISPASLRPLFSACVSTALPLAA